MLKNLAWGDLQAIRFLSRSLQPEVAKYLCPDIDVLDRFNSCQSREELCTKVSQELYLYWSRQHIVTSQEALLSIQQFFAHWDNPRITEETALIGLRGITREAWLREMVRSLAGEKAKKSPLDKIISRFHRLIKF